MKPRKPNQRKAIPVKIKLAIGASLLVAGLAACGAHAVTPSASPAASSPAVASKPAPKPAGQTLTLNLISGGCLMSMFDSNRTDGFSAGSQVVVKDASGKIITTATLGNATSECDFPATITLPTEQTYQITVASLPAYVLTLSDAQRLSWNVTINLEQSGSILCDLGASHTDCNAG
jgi:hypothetical protein